MKKVTQIPLADVKTFVLTGIETNGKRFKIETPNYSYACCINLWRGSMWALMNSGKRILLKRVYN